MPASINIGGRVFSFDLLDGQARAILSDALEECDRLAEATIFRRPLPRAIRAQRTYVAASGRGIRCLQRPTGVRIALMSDAETEAHVIDVGIGSADRNTAACAVVLLVLAFLAAPESGAELEIAVQELLAFLDSSFLRQLILRQFVREV